MCACVSSYSFSVINRVLCWDCRYCGEKLCAAMRIMNRGTFFSLEFNPCCFFLDFIFVCICQCIEKLRRALHNYRRLSGKICDYCLEINHVKLMYEQKQRWFVHEQKCVAYNFRETQREPNIMHTLHDMRLQDQ